MAAAWVGAVRKAEGGRLDRFHRRQDSGNLIVEPAPGRSINRSSVESGNTTHSRPRARTRAPDSESIKVIVGGSARTN